MRTSALSLLLFVPLTLGQEIASPENALTIRFQHHTVEEVLHFPLDQFVYDEATNSYSLALADVQLALVRDFTLRCVYDLDWPVTIKCSHSFTVGDLPPAWPAPAAHTSRALAPAAAIFDGWVELLEEAVHVQVETAPIALPARDDYYLVRGHESHYLESEDQDGGFVHGAAAHPSPTGIVNWWSTRAAGERNLIQGGLVRMSCNRPGCWMSVAWNVNNWPMPDLIDGMHMTNEWWASDLTAHQGRAEMKVGFGAADAGSTSLDVDGCEGEVTPAEQAPVVPQTDAIDGQ